MRTGILIRNLRHASLYKNLKNEHGKFQFNNFKSKGNIAVQNMKVKKNQFKIVISIIHGLLELQIYHGKEKNMIIQEIYNLYL